MPMENIKQSFSDVVHNWTVITMIALFLFSTSPVVKFPAEASVVRPRIVVQEKTAEQIKKETLEKYSSTVYGEWDQLSDFELKELLLLIGFEGSALKTAWAIAKRESNGRPMAYNGNRKTGDSSYGIFQINMLGNLGIDRKEKFDLKSNKELFDPVRNVEITYYMTDGGKDWSAWKGLTPRAQEWLEKFPDKEK
jgi:hypothetical protein